MVQIHKAFTDDQVTMMYLRSDSGVTITSLISKESKTAI